METNKIYTGDNVAVMSTFPDECIDLVVTSPPYDNLRTYGGHSWDFEGVAKELTRVLKKGGVIVWVVADATVNGSETLTSMRQAIHFKDVCGLRVHDTMLYMSNKPPLTHNRYEQSWEYAFVFSKESPARWNPLLRDTSTKGALPGRFMQKASDSEYKAAHKKVRTGDQTYRTNAWYYSAGHDSDNLEHPAPFPYALASDHIQSWSNVGDVVLDPFAGSGTTLKAAKELGRKYIGIEINPDYVEICNKRIAQEVFNLF